MIVTVASLVLTPCGLFYRATLTAGGQVVGVTLVCGRTRAQALKAARAIAARVSDAS